MTAPKRRQTYPAAQMEAALADAAERGVEAASADSGIPAGTLRSRIARARTTPHVEPAARPAGAVSVDELEAEIRRAMRRGKSGDVKNLKVAVAVAERTARENRAAEPTPTVDLTGPAGRTRLERVTQRFVELAQVKQAPGLRGADDATLAHEIERRRAIVKRMRREVRWLREERVRRVAGVPSLFDAVQWPPEGVVGRVEQPTPEHLEPGGAAPLTPRITTPMGSEREPTDEQVAEFYDERVAASRADPKVVPFRRRVGGSVQEEFLRAQGIDPALFRPSR